MSKNTGMEEIQEMVEQFAYDNIETVLKDFTFDINYRYKTKDIIVVMNNADGEPLNDIKNMSLKKMVANMIEYRDEGQASECFLSDCEYLNDVSKVFLGFSQKIQKLLKKRGWKPK